MRRWQDWLREYVNLATTMRCSKNLDILYNFESFSVYCQFTSETIAWLAFALRCGDAAISLISNLSASFSSIGLFDCIDCISKLLLFDRFPFTLSLAGSSRAYGT